MKALGIIFANLQNENIDELTRKRTTASIPFGGRYRLIDFALSSLVNAEISKVAVLAQKNYQSLMDHLGSGKDWDLSRRSGGITIFPPFGNYKSDFIYTTHLEALKSIVGYLNRSTEEYVVLMDCDSIHTVDLGEALEYHISKNADITLIYNHGVVEKSMANFMNETSELVTKLENLSVDINKFFNEDEEDDLWKKFCSGDHAVFARNIVKKLNRKQIIKIRDEYERNPSIMDYYLDFIDNPLLTSFTYILLGLLILLIKQEELLFMLI